MGNKNNINNLSADIFNIEIIRQVKIPQYFLYEIEISLKKEEGIIKKITDKILNKNKEYEFNPYFFLCSGGFNCLRFGENKIYGFDIMQKQKIKSGQKIKGYIAFKKGNKATNKIKLLFSGKELILKNIKVDVYGS